MVNNGQEGTHMVCNIIQISMWQLNNYWMLLAGPKCAKKTHSIPTEFNANRIWCMVLVPGLLTQCRWVGTKLLALNSDPTIWVPWQKFRELAGQATIFFYCPVLVSLCSLQPFFGRGTQHGLLILHPIFFKVLCTHHTCTEWLSELL